jgi:hypothetical protein
MFSLYASNGGIVQHWVYPGMIRIVFLGSPDILTVLLVWAFPEQ